MLKFGNLSFKWGNLELVGEVVPYHCGVGEEGMFLSSIGDTYSCGFCEMWCLVRVEDNWSVESGLGRV